MPNRLFAFLLECERRCKKAGDKLSRFRESREAIEGDDVRAGPIASYSSKKRREKDKFQRIHMDSRR